MNRELSNQIEAASQNRQVVFKRTIPAWKAPMHSLKQSVTEQLDEDFEKVVSLHS